MKKTASFDFSIGPPHPGSQLNGLESNKALLRRSFAPAGQKLAGPSKDKTHQASALNLQDRPPRILFVGEAVSLAHVGRPLMLAQWAKEAGAKVSFACGHHDRFGDMILDAGIELRPLDTISSQSFFERINAGRFFYTPEELRRYIQAERALLRDVQPDLVVGDFRLTLSISARLENIPLLTLINVHWSPAASCPLPPPDKGLWSRLPHRLRELIFHPLRPLAFRFFARPLDDLRRSMGLPVFGDFRKHYTAGDSCAYLDMPGFIPLSAPLPSGHFHLGPLPWRPAHTLNPSNISSLDEEARRPLAYVSMGSSGAVSLLPSILESLLRLDTAVVVSGIGPRHARALFERLPTFSDRLLIRKCLDPTPVLKRARVAVCHGGSGTVYQCLEQGVPVLCLPSLPDQSLVGAAVEASGSGRTLPAEEAGPEQLKKGIQQLLAQPSYRDSARRWARAMHAHDTKARWLEVLSQGVPVCGPSASLSLPVPLNETGETRYDSDQTLRPVRSGLLQYGLRPGE